MTNTELMKLKAALEAKQMELAAQLRVRVKELTIEGCQSELVDWIQVMSDRDEIAGILNRLSSTLADVKPSLRAMDDDCYGSASGVTGQLPLSGSKAFPGRLTVSNARSSWRRGRSTLHPIYTRR